MNGRIMGAPLLSEYGRTSSWELALMVIAVIVILIFRPSPVLGTTCGALLSSISEARRRSSGP